MAPTPTAASLSPARTRRGPRSTARTDRVTSAGTVARSTSASPRSWAWLGSGRGSQRSPGSVGAAGSGEVSNRTETMSIPDPSAARDESRARAKRILDPSASHSSHSGLSRSTNSAETLLPARSRS